MERSEVKLTHDTTRQALYLLFRSLGVVRNAVHGQHAVLPPDKEEAAVVVKYHARHRQRQAPVLLEFRAEFSPPAPPPATAASTGPARPLPRAGGRSLADGVGADSSRHSRLSDTGE